jgi:hypothetical protein
MWEFGWYPNPNPAGLDDSGLPIGMQITAPFFEEGKLLALVKKIAELTTQYKVIDNFKKGEVLLLEVLEMKNYQSIFNELNLAVKA